MNMPLTGLAKAMIPRREYRNRCSRTSQRVENDMIGETAVFLALDCQQLGSVVCRGSPEM
jgi:hypothetical protein